MKKERQKHDMREGDRGSDNREGGGNRTGEDNSTCDRRTDEGKKGSESKYDKTEVNSRDDDRKESTTK